MEIKGDEHLSHNKLFEKVPLILLLGGICLGVFLLVLQSNSVPLISHDDGISYLSAMGKQGLYAENKPTEAWVQASKWKQFWSQPDYLQFEQIKYDLAHYDIHPPLYFWTLHIWTNILGVDLSTGPLLNVFFHVIITLLIFYISIKLKCSPIISTAVSLLWLINGTIIETATQTRQYSLFTISSLIYLLSLLKYLRERSSLSLFLVGLTTCIGMLIHYHFVLLIAVSILYIGLNHGLENNWRGLFALFASVGLGILIFVAIHPDFYLSFTKQAHQAQDFSFNEIIPRFRTSIVALLSLIDPGLSKRWLVVWAVIVFTLITYICFLSFKHVSDRKVLLSPKTILLKYEDFFPVFYALLTTAIVINLYVLQHSPKHAMNAKYLLFISPVYFIILGQLLNAVSFESLFKPLKYFVAAILIFQVTITTRSVFQYVKNSENALVNISNSLPPNIPVILDSTARGVLPKALWHVNATSDVYAANQIQLINNFPALSAMPSILYVSNLFYDNSYEGQKQILKEFQNRGYRVVQESSFFGNETFYLKRSK